MTNLELIRIDGGTVTITLNDHMSFGGLKMSLERTIPATALSGLTRENIEAGKTQLNSVGWIEGILSNAIIKPEKYKEMGNIYNDFDLKEFTKLSEYVGEYYPLGPTLAAIGNAFGVGSRVVNNSENSNQNTA